MTRSHRLRPAVALATALAIAALGAGSAAAAGSPVLLVTLSDRCVASFDNVKGGTLTVTLKRAGKVIDTATLVPKASWTTCLDTAIKGNDTLVVKHVKNGSTLLNRTVKLPVLTVSLDAPNETVHGSGSLNGAPIVGGDIVIEATKTLGAARGIGMISPDTFDSSGKVAKTFSGLIATDLTYVASLTWRNGAGTEVTVQSADPTVVIRAGKPAVAGFGKAGASTTITLKTAGGALRATATATAAATFAGPTYKGTFKSGTTKVSPAVGDKVTSSRLTGSWTVLANTLAITSGEGTGTATVTCPGVVDAALSVDGTQAWEQPFSTDEVSFTDQFIPSGSTVEVLCQDANGFAQAFTGVAP